MLHQLRTRLGSPDYVRFPTRQAGRAGECHKSPSTAFGQNKDYGNLNDSKLEAESTLINIRDLDTSRSPVMSRVGRERPATRESSQPSVCRFSRTLF